MTLKLFGDDSDLEERGEDNDNLSINKEYARRFEHNKKREDLQRLEELKKKGLVDEDDSAESSDEELEEQLAGSSKVDDRFFDILNKVKKKDPVIYSKDAKLYPSEDEDGDEEDEGTGGDQKGRKTKRKEKPLYIKDVTAMHLLEDGPELEEKPVSILRESQSKIYSEEQEKIRQAFLEDADASESDNGEDEFFKERKKGSGEADDNDQSDVVVRKKMDEFFGEDDNLDQNELFLKNFLANKMWIDKEKKKNNLDEDDLLLDEEELEKQEKYESEYNFRYEEDVDDRVLGHSRFIEGSVRKKSNARKEQRKKKEERMAQAEFERKEELKHLKNLKKKEIREKLEKIRAIAGIGEDADCKLRELDLEEDFDPDEYDKKMEQMFGADYYDAEDADPGFVSDEDGLVKPDFDKEDELLGIPKDWDVVGSGDGFAEARKRSLKRKEEEEEADEENKGLEEVGEEEIEEDRHESKRKKKRKVSLKEKIQLDKELEEYYKLDYEGTIGDLKTRFKYKTVEPRKYGLSAADILMLDDKQLNQYVSLKKIAPYRPDEWKVPKMKRNQIRQLLHGETTDQNQRNTKQKFSVSADNNEKPSEKPDAEMPTKNQSSRSSRRRKRLAELKPSLSRLIAYGKVKPTKSKNHKKH